MTTSEVNTVSGVRTKRGPALTTERTFLAKMKSLPIARGFNYAPTPWGLVMERSEVGELQRQKWIWCSTTLISTSRIRVVMGGRYLVLTTRK